MIENKIKNYEVLVNLAKDSTSSHFSGRPICRGLVQVIMEKTDFVLD